MNTRIADSCESSRANLTIGGSTDGTLIGEGAFIGDENGDVTPPEGAVLNKDGDNETAVVDEDGDGVCDDPNCRDAQALDLGDTGTDVTKVAESAMGNT